MGRGEKAVRRIITIKRYLLFYRCIALYLQPSPNLGANTYSSRDYYSCHSQFGRLLLKSVLTGQKISLPIIKTTGYAFNIRDENYRRARKRRQI